MQSAARAAPRSSRSSSEATCTRQQPGLRCKTTRIATTYMPSALAQVLSGEGTCQNICDLQEKDDEAWYRGPARCVDKLDGWPMFWIVVLAFFPVVFAISMAVFCDCKKCPPCCDEAREKNVTERVKKTLLRNSIIVVFGRFWLNNPHELAFISFL